MCRELRKVAIRLGVALLRRPTRRQSAARTLETRIVIRKGPSTSGLFDTYLSAHFRRP